LHLGGAFVRAQIPYDQTNFRSPLDIPLVLAGTFGELRSNHFHAGIDIKTRGKEGFPVIAIEDGYVSRVKTRPGGYGKALYFTHANGYTSVYAHLQKFHKSVGVYVLDKQYEKKQFSVDLFPEKEQFTYQKGDTIAWTGNSGSSTAPHLHFEIRDTKSQQTINPLLFGFKAKDTTPPTIKNVHIYPLDDSATINGAKDTLRMSVTQLKPGKYKVDGLAPNVSGAIGFGIDVFDRLDNAPNKNGVYSIELFIDSSLVYKHKMERFSFSETRYINSLMDYHAKKNYSLRPQKSFKDPNNNLSVYEHLENEGRLNFDTNENHIAEYLIRDKAGNVSKITFEFYSDNSLTISSTPQNENVFLYNEDNEFVEENIELFIKENSLYDNIEFSYSTHSSEEGFIADMHCIHKIETPLHSAFNIALAIDSLDESLRDKALICSVNKKGKVSCLNTQWQNDTLIAKSKMFGDFSAVIDTIAPILKPKSFSKDLTEAELMSFTVEDTLSGLSTYDAYVDGEWILLEYDPKNKMLIHYFDGKVESGQHELEIIVEDSVKNEKRIKLQFLR
jgi:hypothetical protein